MAGDSYAVSIRGLFKSYSEGGRKRPVLKDVNADLQCGAMHAIIGRSGSGKSTLLNLIAGIDVPDEGEIEAAGCKMTGLDERRRTLLRRKNIGIVFQFFNLIPSLTVSENIMLPLELNNESDRADRVREAVENIGLSDRCHSYPSALSGGEQQRVAIARAVVHQPRLILADEPTGNLDERAARKVVATLAEAKRQCTVVVVTHSMELAEHCDCKWLLRSGTIGLL